MYTWAAYGSLSLLISYQVHFINPLSAVLVTTSCIAPVSVLGVSEGALIGPVFYYINPQRKNRNNKQLKKINKKFKNNNNSKSVTVIPTIYSYQHT